MNTISTVLKSLFYLLSICLVSALSVVHADVQEKPFTSLSIYDAAGRVVGTIAPDPDGTGPLKYPATRTNYNARGLPDVVQTGELASWLDDRYNPITDWSIYSTFTVISTTSYTYDDRGNIATKSVTGKNGYTIESMVQYSYDKFDRVLCKAIRMNPLNYSSLPTDACVLSTQGNFGPDRIFRYSYSDYDQVGKEERAVGTNLQQVYADITINGKLPTIYIDANGNKTTLVYENSRLKKRIYPSKTTKGQSSDVDYPDYEEYAYDLNGNVIWERKRNGAIFTYTYDNLNRQLTKDGPGTSMDVTYTYDLRDLKLSSRFTSNNQGITNVFNGFGLLESSTNNMLGTSRTLGYQYDQNGNRTRITHPDGNYFAYQFDQHNRINALNENTTNLLTVAYQNNGRRSNITRANSSITRYNFDNANRLESFAQDLSGTLFDLTNTFKYNIASQATEMTQSNNLYYYTGNENLAGNYTVNGLNQYTNVAGQAFVYDAKGNLTNDGARTYTYDDENHLIGTSGNITSTLVYDPLGRLFQTTIAGVVTQFLYDGDALVAEYNSSGAITKRYVHGDQVDEPLVQYNGAAVSSSSRFYLHADHQGSIIAQSNMSGTVNTLAYDTYGIPANKNLDRFGYTGQIWLKELGLFHYKARVYSPKLGRFLQTDPIYYEDQMNIYAYVGNDPINMIDPTGEVGLLGAFVMVAIVSTAVWMAVDTGEKGMSTLQEGRMEKLETMMDGSAPSEASDMKIKQGTELLGAAKAFGDIGSSIGDGSISGSTEKAVVSGVGKVVTTEIKSELSPEQGAENKSKNGNTEQSENKERVKLGI